MCFKGDKVAWGDNTLSNVDIQCWSSANWEDESSSVNSFGEERIPKTWKYQSWAEGGSHIPFPRSRPTAQRAQSLSHQGPSCFQILLSSHFPENWETFGAHMEPAQTEFADSVHSLRPDNAVMSHLGSNISTELRPSPSVRTRSSDQTAWALNRCKTDCNFLSC